MSKARRTHPVPWFFFVKKMPVLLDFTPSIVYNNSDTALITAFRAEVTQNSISPEKVGSILQQIADLLATAAPDSDMSEFTVLRQRLIGVSTR